MSGVQVECIVARAEAQAESGEKRSLAYTPFRLWGHTTLLQPRDYPHTRTPRHLCASSPLAWETNNHASMTMFLRYLVSYFNV